MPRDPFLLDRARTLRQNMSDAEKQLWFRLRRKKLAGFRFRRQVPIGNYIADFACLSARLVIEVDGGRHRDRDSRLFDARRTAFFESRGYLVLRFWNSFVLSDIDGVVANIYNALDRRPTPHPALRATLPAGEGRLTKS